MKHPPAPQIRFRHSFDHPPIPKTEFEPRVSQSWKERKCFRRGRLRNCSSTFHWVELTGRREKKKRLERDMIRFEIERVHTELPGGWYHKPSSTTTTPFFVKARGARGVRDGCSYSRQSTEKL
ncbi:hypothetical protein CEXT_91891 [Caerostris extrusa]|uniref:Uncharacterized protein n=1 Tax=Caerostris extrusa TaxID=172846 RepID=A0AAV4M4S0_CAEEX|nr:hypothetical protein CEXT_91891 [Caerostris extrusa]